MQTTNQAVTIINAEGLILGRMSSIIAKRLLKGEKITIVNAEKAVFSGKKKSRVSEKKEFLEVGHPKKGPFHHRRPDRIVRRTVRGMLPYKQPKGKQAHKRLKAFIGIPEELKNQKMETLAEAHAKKLTCAYFTLGELAKEIGWNPSE
ncbi:MAG: 50S ribosomal protein L13 [Candidatus Bathyarchaeota archaeon]|nr:50S ribosomal protein L13 [Candidatus Bathyarchaeota archaeon]MDH5746853.1 50S ribosomal protein L13 [Candidatus Bathyarchaeota archaeon]